MPIIIDQTGKMASFYQFKDNHIYNFEYENTFIGELVEMGCVLELACSADQAQTLAAGDGDETDVSNTERSQMSQFAGEQVSVSANHKRRTLDPN